MNQRTKISVIHNGAEIKNQMSNVTYTVLLLFESLRVDVKVYTIAMGAALLLTVHEWPAVL